MKIIAMLHQLGGNGEFCDILGTFREATGYRSKLDRTGWQRLAEHLESVSTIAGILASLSRPDDMQFTKHASFAGLLHDYGKYADCFQNMLATGHGTCKHAIHGALLSHLGTRGGETKPVCPQVALAIAGHHSGIPDYTGSGNSLTEKVKDERYREKRITCSSVPPKTH